MDPGKIRCLKARAATVSGRREHREAMAAKGTVLFWLRRVRMSS